MPKCDHCKTKSKRRKRVGQLGMLCSRCANEAFLLGTLSWLSGKDLVTPKFKKDESCQE